MHGHLNDAELADICRPLTQHAARIRYLRTLGLRVERRPDGSPLVRRADWESWRVCWLPDAPLPLKPETLWAETPLGRWQAEQRVAAAESASDAKKAEVDLAQWRKVNRKQIAAQKADAKAALIRHHAGKRIAAKLQRTPAWADFNAIRAIYIEAHQLTVATGVVHHVDHEVPLQGRLASGLHVHNNLRVITGVENSRKRNRFEPC